MRVFGREEGGASRDGKGTPVPVSRSGPYSPMIAKAAERMETHDSAKDVEPSP